MIDELRKGPAALDELKTRLVDNGLIPRATFYRRITDYKEGKKIMELPDGRLVLAGYSQLEEDLERVLRRDTVFSFIDPFLHHRATQETDPEFYIRTYLPLLGYDPKKSENRDAFFRVYNKLVLNCAGVYELVWNAEMPEKIRRRLFGRGSG